MNNVSNTVLYHNYKIEYDQINKNWRVPGVRHGHGTPVVDDIGEAYKIIDNDRRFKPMKELY